jgi:hypothetical protein
MASRSRCRAGRWGCRRRGFTSGCERGKEFDVDRASLSGAMQKMKDCRSFGAALRGAFKPPHAGAAGTLFVVSDVDKARVTRQVDRF